jgi:hypothetical protein
MTSRTRVVTAFTSVRTFCRSCRTVAATFGYCTLTATSVPSASVARCTWPSDAAANASGSKRAKRSSGGAPSSRMSMSRTRSYGMGGTLDCTTASRSSASLGKRSVRIESIWTSFMNAPRSSVEPATMRSAFRMCAASRFSSARSCDWNGRLSACQR